ncbi:MAG TPA: hypothetical protein VMU86_04490 [Steroidobacteraceae bacterium]|nr:hypothetical protein [Steroidobacteraceae bacterium]
MARTLSLLLLGVLAEAALAAPAAVTIDTAGRLYLAAGLRQQVAASLAGMPAKLKEMFVAESQGKLDAQRLAAVTKAAKLTFRIDVFEPSALAAFAANLDPQAAQESLAFLASPAGERMVSADVALAKLDPAVIDQIASGKIAAPTTPQRTALFKQIESAGRATDSAAEVYMTIGRSLAVGKAMGYGLSLEDAQVAVGKKAPPTPAPELLQSLEVPLGRYVAYDYRGLSDADLRAMLAFLDSPAGKTYVNASIDALVAGFRSMSRRCGERIGESWREIAQSEAQDEAAVAPSAPH